MSSENKAAHREQIVQEPTFRRFKSGARNHRNRLVSPSRWTWSDRRSYVIWSESPSADFKTWESGGNRRGNPVGKWESDWCFQGPEPVLVRRDPGAEGQPPVRTRVHSPPRAFSPVQRGCVMRTQQRGPRDLNSQDVSITVRIFRTRVPAT